jgi:membrane protein required for colicin V production
LTIDVLFIILLLLAIIRGWRRGIIVGIFSLLSLFIGLAAAVRLSAWVAGAIREYANLSSRWLPVLAFLLVFVGVVLIVRWAALLIKSVVDFAWLGWADKLGGILLYACIYTIVFSVILFYAGNLHLISPTMKSSSVFYSFIEPWGPVSINALGKLIPWFQDMFRQLENFFSRFDDRAAAIHFV